MIFGEEKWNPEILNREIPSFSLQVLVETLVDPFSLVIVTEAEMGALVKL